MSEFSRETLLNIIETDHVQCGDASALARMALAAMDSEPAIADCDPEVYEKGVSVCLVAIPKETAEVICQNITAATGCKVDWHYFGGRVHIKALRESSQPAPVVQCPFPCGWDNLNKLAIQDAAFVARGLVEGEPTTEAQRQAAISNNYRLLKVISSCRAAMLQAGNSPVIPDGSVAMFRRWLAFGHGMQNAGCQLPHNLIAETEVMLAAAPQSPGSEPATVPGKWIPVSERMPIEFEAVIAFDGDQVYGEAMYSSDDGFTIDGYEPCDRLNLQNVTHWMPLPAAPREVK